MSGRWCAHHVVQGQLVGKSQLPLKTLWSLLRLASEYCDSLNDGMLPRPDRTAALNSCNDFPRILMLPSPLWPWQRAQLIEKSPDKVFVVVVATVLVDAGVVVLAGGRLAGVVLLPVVVFFGFFGAVVVVVGAGVGAGAGLLLLACPQAKAMITIDSSAVWRRIASLTFIGSPLYKDIIDFFIKILKMSKYL